MVNPPRHFVMPTHAISSHQLRLMLGGLKPTVSLGNGSPRRLTAEQYTANLVLLSYPLFCVLCVCPHYANGKGLIPSLTSGTRK